MKYFRISYLFTCTLLVITACNRSSNDTNSTSYATYKEALAAEDFEAAHKIFAQAEADYAWMKNNDFKAFKKKYGIIDLDDAKEEIFDREIKYLAAQGTHDANARIVFLFSDFEIKGQHLPKGLNDYFEGAAIGSGNGYKYSVSVQKLNSKLDMVLDLAISLDNRELANSIIKLYKENMDIFKGSGSGKDADRAPDGTKVDGNHCYITYNWNDKEAALKKYEENFGKLKE